MEEDVLGRNHVSRGGEPITYLLFADYISYSLTALRDLCRLHCNLFWVLNKHQASWLILEPVPFVHHES